MAEDIYAKPDLTKKVRFQTGKKDDRPTDVCDNVDCEDTVRIYDNCWAEESAPPDKSQDNTAENQPQINLSPEKRSLPGAAVVSLGLLCLLLLVAVISLVVVLILERNRLWGDNASLTSERDKLQTSYSQVKILNHNLTQETRQLEEENSNLTQETRRLEEENSNLTKIVDELQKQIETTFCPASWIRFGTSCYLMPKSKESWTDSKKACETHNAQLVIISNREEQEFISSFNREIWIGLTDEEREGEWKWVDGKPLTIEYWGHDQPDNKGPDGKNENCAQISDAYRVLENWNDLVCSTKLYFTCEKILE